MKLIAFYGSDMEAEKEALKNLHSLQYYEPEALEIGLCEDCALNFQGKVC